MFLITHRQLGVGAAGQVFMAIDRWKRCQVACKIVNLTNNFEQQAGCCGMTSSAYQRVRENGQANQAQRLWREVELLRKLSHVCLPIFDCQS